MRLHFAGIKPYPLGSVQDKIFRDFIERETTKEIKKNQFLYHISMISLVNAAFMGLQKADFNASKEKMRKLWGQYIELEYGIEIPEHTDKEIQMMEYYEDVVKKLKPKLKRKKGKLSVEGLEKI